MKGQGRLLITGGLGYIGSHTIVDLIGSGYEVVSLDNEINSSGRVLDGIEKITGKRVENIHIDLTQSEKAVQAVKDHGDFDGIIHFAALKSVEESVHMPARYFQNNVGGVITTLHLMDALDIQHIIFSSSCTVYGSPDTLPVTEKTPIAKAESPYGASKQASEIMYEQYFSAIEKNGSHKSGLSLRYFNPAGAHPSALIGEASLGKPTNLVPVITETAVGVRDELVVYGVDYPTRDGSCLRDYIHVMDLAKAHTLAIEYLFNGKNKSPYEAFNLGMGEGVTVLEALTAFERITGQKVNTRMGPRRPGDVAAIYADPSLAKEILNWKPELTMDDIMQTAWAWEKARAK
jgi:UDP-glucose 4-epimerase